MPLITNTHAQELPLGEGKRQRLTGQMLGGTLAGDQVSQFAGAPPESEQNGTENIHNNSDESKVLGYSFILAAARTTIKAVRGKTILSTKLVCEGS